MEEAIFRQPELVGREEELGKLIQHLDNAVSGKGSTVLVSGEAGIGKTRLIQEFREHATGQEIKILHGAATADTAHPFLVFSKALETEIARPLFHEQEYTSFASIFAVNRAGLLVAQASPEDEELDADIFAGMLSAVQDFVRDSFDSSGTQKAGLGRLEYGDMTILIEHGQHLFLTAVMKGAEHPDMKALLGRTLKSIEAGHMDVLESWSGKEEEVLGIQEEVSAAAVAKFLVKRDLEGVKLENERIRIADRILQILIQMSNSKPLLFFMEDIHWADESSLFVMQYLARNIGGERIMLICTLRPRENALIEESIKMIKDEETATILDLEKLGVDDVSILVDEMYANAEFPPGFIDNLTSHCEGNPFFVIEMLRQMQEEGNIFKFEDTYSLVTEDYTIPNSIEDIVQRRLEGFEPDAMALVEYASCIGREFETDAVLSFRSVKDAPSALAKASEAGVMRVMNGSAEFSHAIFQEVTYESIGERWKSVYHKSIGEYYESVYMDERTEVIYELAKHFSRSNECGKAFDYCLRAAEKAEASFAPEQAIEFYRKALAALSKSRKDMRAIEEEIRILEALGDLKAFVGEFEDALDYYSKVVELADDKEARARMHRKMGRVLVDTADFEKAKETARKGKEILGDSQTLELGRLNVIEAITLRVQGQPDKSVAIYEETLDLYDKINGEDKDYGNLYQSLGNLYRKKGEFDRGLELFKKSLEHYERLEDDHEKALLLNNLGNVYCDKGEFDAALETYGSAKDMMEKIGDRKGLAIVANNVGVLWAEVGNKEKTIEHYLEAIEGFRRIGLRQALATVLNNIGNVHAHAGEFEEAKKYHTESLELRRKIGDKDGVAQSLNNIGLTYSDQGKFDEALEHYQDSLNIAEEIGDISGIALAVLNIGEANLYKGEFKQAIDYHERALALLIETGDTRTTVNCYCGLSHAYLDLGQIDKAGEYAGMALKNALEIKSVLQEAMARSQLSDVYLAQGKLDEAEKELDLALSQAEESGERNMAAYITLQQGLLAKAKNQTEDARAALEKALATYEEMGMKIWIERCKVALEEI